MRHGADVLPGYKHITQAKINSRPLRTEFTEVSAKANLQDLMDHTAKRLLESLPENEKKLTPTVHKILAHGKDIIEYQSLPIGELSEEAQESLNKFYKKYRLQNTFKASRVKQIEDLFNMLAASSDPLISSLRHVKSRKELQWNYTSEMISLLIF
ncbi:hypothetical protein EVAR_91334_1 [Eumeta japonica]|uniref:Uncharacterized protein n=1 Tax=Eumeta variegata TaxID=151549 RepID=A0A4C1TTD5_EUMVA|nr:hypothetical protein EVAR_91334_1 [Eumeta japonica]